MTLMSRLQVVVCVLALLLISSSCFTINCFTTTAARIGYNGRALARSKHNGLSMEYIPDGLTKKEWEQLKKKEADELKAKVCQKYAFDIG